MTNRAITRRRGAAWAAPAASWRSAGRGVRARVHATPSLRAARAKNSSKTLKNRARKHREHSFSFSAKLLHARLSFAPPAFLCAPPLVWLGRYSISHGVTSNCVDSWLTRVRVRPPTSAPRLGRCVRGHGLRAPHPRRAGDVGRADHCLFNGKYFDVVINSKLNTDA